MAWKWTAFIINHNDLVWLKNNVAYLKYNFDEIIIVDGADEVMGKVKQDIWQGMDTVGPSSDPETLTYYEELTKELERLNSLDPIRKIADIKIIHPDRFWKDKTEMCNAAWAAATGDYLFQIDTDEFYKPDDLYLLKEAFIKSGSHIGTVPVLNFWHDFGTNVKGKDWNAPFVRMFMHLDKCQFGFHRPPNIVKIDGGKVNTKTWAAKNGLLYHFGYIGDRRIWRKSKYFKTLRPTHPTYGKFDVWYKNVWLKWPFNPKEVEKQGLHINGTGTTSRFTGQLPQAILNGEWPTAYWGKHGKGA